MHRAHRHRLTPSHPSQVCAKTASSRPMEPVHAIASHTATVSPTARYPRRHGAVSHTAWYPTHTHRARYPMCVQVQARCEGASPVPVPMRGTRASLGCRCRCGTGASPESRCRCGNLDLMAYSRSSWKPVDALPCAKPSQSRAEAIWHACAPERRARKGRVQRSALGVA